MEKKSEIEPVINDLVKMTEMCYEKDKEIERLNGALQTHEILLKSNVLEIERLNNIINELEDILKRDIKACNNKFENMFDRNYRKLILEEKLEQLQELKGSDSK